MPLAYPCAAHVPPTCRPRAADMRDVADKPASLPGAGRYAPEAITAGESRAVMTSVPSSIW